MWIITHTWYNVHEAFESVIVLRECEIEVPSKDRGKRVTGVRTDDMYLPERGISFCTGSHHVVELLRFPFSSYWECRVKMFLDLFLRLTGSDPVLGGDLVSDIDFSTPRDWPVKTCLPWSTQILPGGLSVRPPKPFVHRSLSLLNIGLFYFFPTIRLNLSSQVI